jgi:hypothetical protein
MARHENEQNPQHITDCDTAQVYAGHAFYDKKAT